MWPLRGGICADEQVSNTVTFSDAAGTLFFVVRFLEMQRRAERLTLISARAPAAMRSFTAARLERWTASVSGAGAA